MPVIKRAFAALLYGGCAYAVFQFSIWLDSWTTVRTDLYYEVFRWISIIASFAVLLFRALIPDEYL